MSWLNEFAKGIFGIYSGNTLEAFQPLDFFHFYPMWYDLWIERIDEAIKKLKLEQKAYEELKHLLPVPSNKRAIIQKIIPSYRAFKIKDREKVKRVTNFFARMLMEACPDDPFAQRYNRIHSSRHLDEMYGRLNWNQADENVARKSGRLLTAAASLVHGLYNDLVTDFGWDTYGPYQNERQTLLIRHFPDLQPKELWSNTFLASIKELTVYGLYEGVEWEISAVGCHTLVKGGNPIAGLKKYVVLADGRELSLGEIEKLIIELASKAELIYKEIRRLDFEQLKEKVMFQECYQLKKMFDQAGMDWKPTMRMFERIKNRPLLNDLLPRGRMMNDVQEFKQTFGFDEFEREVLT